MEFKTTDCGRYGKAIEMAISGKERVQAQGKTDARIDRKAYEIKTGAGVLSYNCLDFFKGSPRVIYIPVPVDGAPIEKQDGYVVTRKAFLELLNRCGLIRRKVSTQGAEEITIQTFWNRKKNAPHGTKYYKLLQELRDNCEMTLAELMEGRA